MAAWGYEISLLVLKNISRLEEKFRILYVLPKNKHKARCGEIQRANRTSQALNKALGTRNVTVKEMFMK